MDVRAISQLYKINLGLMLVAFVGTWHYLDLFDALGLLAGGVWGCANLYFLDKLLQEWLKGPLRSNAKFYTMVGIKFPVLYAIGFVLLKIDFFPIFSLISGFSLLFLSIIFFGVATQLSHLTLGQTKNDH